ncbi:MAG: hypothetical protein V4733_00640 [Verrucomicrobiota bacterium]
MSEACRIHLLTYATRRFRHRQFILGLSGRVNGVVDTVEHWNPVKAAAAGFEERCPGISLGERGSGFWAWKPFIIARKLAEVPDGDVVFYCDVGRIFPYKQLTASISPYLRWMETHHQDVMPGISIPWKGPMSVWTKRDAFVLTGMDLPEVHAAIPIQASFSFWKASPSSRALADDWLRLAARRELISDDPSVCGLPELPHFHDHRHDQTLLTLCCLKHAVQSLPIGTKMPAVDTKHPSEVSELVFGPIGKTKPVANSLLRGIASILEFIEQRVRKKIKFGEPLTEPASVHENPAK